MNRTLWPLAPSLRTILASVSLAEGLESMRHSSLLRFPCTGPRIRTLVESVPSDILHESYFHLRSKALQQRQNTPSGSTCYDMEVLNPFWSHFLIRNFNIRMYEELQRLALDDAVYNGTDVGLLNLIKLYSLSLLSPQTMARYRVIHDYVAVVEFEDDDYCPAFTQLQSNSRSECLHSSSRQRLQRLLTSDVLALLEI